MYFCKWIQMLPSFHHRQPLALNSEKILIGEHLLEVTSLHPHHHSPHTCKKNEMNTQEALQKRDSGAQSDWSLQDTQEGDGITSPLRCSARELRTPRRRAIHRPIQLISSFFFFLAHVIRKEVLRLNIEACLLKIKRIENHISIELKKESYLSPSTQHPVTTTNAS